MNAAKTPINLEELDDNFVEEVSSDNANIDEGEAPQLLESSEFALKMINSVKAMNNGELSHYEMVNSFSLADELKCLFMFMHTLLCPLQLGCLTVRAAAGSCGPRMWSTRCTARIFRGALLEEIPH